MARNANPYKPPKVLHKRATKPAKLYQFRPYCHQPNYHSIQGLTSLTFRESHWQTEYVFTRTPVKFFVLSGLGNEQDQYLMAIKAHAACIRNSKMIYIVRLWRKLGIGQRYFLWKGLWVLKENILNGS